MAIMSDSFQKRLFPNLPEIIKKFGTPFHIYDEEGIRGGVRSFVDQFSSRGLQSMIYFAVKALPRREVLKILLEEGCGFDCSQPEELMEARIVGAKPGAIMFTSNNTSKRGFQVAAADGGCILNLDDETLIDKVPDPYPELACFRVNPGDRKTGDEVNSIIGDPKSAKFGVPIENVVRAYKKAFDRGARRCGLHTMVCSNDRNHKHLLNTVALELEISGVLTKKLGVPVEFINYGGGKGIQYRPTDEEFDDVAFASGVRTLADEFKGKHGYVPAFYAEFGRSVTGPHGVLVNRVINTYTKYKKFVGVEVAMAGIPRVGFYSSAYHHIIVLNPDGTPKSGPTEVVQIVDGLCESNGILTRDIELPIIKVGDIIVACCSAAHCAAMAFQYNWIVRPQELLLRRHNLVQRICREETHADFVSRQINLEGPEHFWMPLS